MNTMKPTREQVTQILYIYNKEQEKVQALAKGIDAINSSYTTLEIWSWAVQTLDILCSDVYSWVEYYLYEAGDSWHCTRHDGTKITVINWDLETLKAVLMKDDLLATG